MVSWTPKLVGIRSFQFFLCAKTAVHCLNKLIEFKTACCENIIMSVLAGIFADLAVQEIVNKARPDLSFWRTFGCVLLGSAISQIKINFGNQLPRRIKTTIKIAQENIGAGLIIGSFCTTVARHSIFNLRQDGRV